VQSLLAFHRSFLGGRRFFSDFARVLGIADFVVLFIFRCVLLVFGGRFFFIGGRLFNFDLRAVGNRVAARCYDRISGIDAAGDLRIPS
jgi:hypothetical protein